MAHKQATTGDIARRMLAFRNDLRRNEPPRIVQRWITHGDAAMLSPEHYFELKEAVAQKFMVHPNEVVVVGSAKLGFSIAPKKRYRQFLSDSDIDVAIVSSALFDRFWVSVYDYSQRGPDPYWQDRQAFQKYLFRGWIRPDKLPRSPAFAQRDDWWEFFRMLRHSRRFRHGISAGLYKSWHFLETYQQVCIIECKTEELRQ
jgi:hypothetical protein